MKTLQKRFTNEIGNTIGLRVSQELWDGVAGIFISMSGPTSLMEYHITTLEAKELHELLGEVLKDSPK